jgi:hypothetical protein
VHYSGSNNNNRYYYEFILHAQTYDRTQFTRFVIFMPDEGYTDKLMYKYTSQSVLLATHNNMYLYL